MRKRLLSSERLLSGEVYKIICDMALEDTRATSGFSAEAACNPFVDEFLRAPSVATIIRVTKLMFQRVDTEVRERHANMMLALRNVDYFGSDGSYDTYDGAGIKHSGTAPEVGTKRAASTDPNVHRCKRVKLWLRDCGKTYTGMCQCCAIDLEVLGAWHAAHIQSRKSGGGEELDNLKVACTNCNQGMGTMNFYEYKQKHFPNVIIAPASTATSAPTNTITTDGITMDPAMDPVAFAASMTNDGGASETTNPATSPTRDPRDPRDPRDLAPDQTSTTFAGLHGVYRSAPDAQFFFV